MKKRLERMMAKMKCMAQVMRSENFCVFAINGRVTTVKGYFPERYHRAICDMAEDLQIEENRKNKN